MSLEEILTDPNKLNDVMLTILITAPAIIAILKWVLDSIMRRTRTISFSDDYLEIKTKTKKKDKIDDNYFY